MAKRPAPTAAADSSGGVLGDISLPKLEPSLSPNAVGKILGITGEAVKQWIYARRLPATKQGNGYWKIRVTDLEVFLQSRLAGARRIGLLCSASPEVQATVAGVLNELGLECMLPANYADALLKLQNQPALIIVDLSSWAEGWKLLNFVREKSRYALPGLLLTGSALPDEAIEQAAQLGVKGCLMLPLEASVLRHEIKVLTQMI